ncbi:MAG: patatin-like phospholipase family protein, partial [Chloroflexi bacterium]|nr:patatin-like phospholipase family protein [Chloroflexota bacterium]
VRAELVLWHPPETERPLGTATWLDTHPVQAHHHVRQDDAAHVNQLARRLTGHAIGLVLGGGAARGFAQLGVHRAMAELSIPIDYIGGTSMGAVMGGYMQISDKNDELMQMAPKFADPKVLFDRTLPITAIMASKKVTQFTKDLYGDLQIEDLWTPFFCIASNLTTAEPVVFERGPLWKAIRASLAIPGVFSPVIHDGDILIDGGVMDNFPVKLMAERCESDRIIGVNVNPLRVKKRKYDFETNISGWRILFSRLNPFAKPLRAPSLFGTIVRAIDVNSKRQIQEQTPFLSVMITPDVRQFPTTHYHKFEAIAQAGYEAALETLREWKKTL